MNYKTKNRSLIRISRLSTVALLLPIALAGCSTTGALHIAVPGASDSITPVQIQHKGGFMKGSYELGAFQAEVRRGWKRETQWTFAHLSSENAKQKFYIELSEADGTWPTACLVLSKSKGIAPTESSHIGLTGGTSLTCGLLSDEEPIATLEIAAGAWEQPNGTIVFPNDSPIEVSPVYEIQGGGRTPVPAGYTFTREGHTVGAVDVFNPTLYLDARNSDETSRLIAAAALAILEFLEEG
jgi:hypothetical protein